jgi:hypothetical protein
VRGDFFIQQLWRITSRKDNTHRSLMPAQGSDMAVKDFRKLVRQLGNRIEYVNPGFHADG